MGLVEAIVVAVAALAATAISAYSAYEQGQAAKEQQEYNAKIAEYNMQVEKNNAFAAQQEADYLAERQKERGEALLARQRVLYAKSGTQMEGSPLLVMTDTAADIALDRETILYRGKVKADQSYSQAALDTMGANLERMKGKSYGRAGNYGAATSLLSGIAQYGSYYGGNTTTTIRTR